jgi:MFS family permease
MVTFVAVPFQLYQLTHSTLQVGLLSVCDAVPLLLLAAVGGTIADRLDRRLLVSGGLACVAGAAAILVAIPSLIRYDSTGQVPVSDTVTNA